MIVSALDASDPFATNTILLTELNRVFAQHLNNCDDIEYLQAYVKGEHREILNRNKTIREDINNRIVVNYAGSTTRDIVAYFLGKSISYIPRKGVDRDAVQSLNNALSSENKDKLDIEIATNLSVCGVGYRGTYLDVDKTNGYSIKMLSHNPLNTFVVHSANPARPPVFCVDYYIVPSNQASPDGLDTNAYGVFTVFTRGKRYTIKTGENLLLDGVSRPQIDFLANDVTVTVEDFSFGGNLPITEYINNQWRMGDWEAAIGLMDAIDLTASDAVNEIEQYVSALLLVIGAEVTPEVKQKIEQMKMVNIKDIPDSKKVTVEYLTSQLQSSETQVLREYLESSLRVVVGVPDRKSRGGGGGDTGDAVFMRDGWQDIDLVAVSKEQFFKESDRSALAVILYILNTRGELEKKSNEPLEANHIDIKFTRTKTSNLMTKAQSYEILVRSGIDPTDALEMVDITTDVLDVIQRSEAYKQKMLTLAQAQVPQQGNSPATAGENTNVGRSDGGTVPQQ